VVAGHRKLLGIGIDPNTIIVVQGDQFEVIGSSRVTITEAGHQQFSIPSGSHFDLRKRKPLGVNPGLNQAAFLVRNFGKSPVRAERKAELAGLTKAKAFYSSKETVLGPCYAFTYAVTMRFECEFLLPNRGN
jgi:hypothetical protein